MNIFTRFRDIIDQAVASLQSSGDLPAEISLRGVNVEPPRESAHGDLATNVAMVLARFAKMKPRDLAEKIAPLLAAHEDVQTVEVAGPGFINIFVANDLWYRLLHEIRQLGDAYGRSELGAGEKVNVEYVSANPTGPMHVGHCRGAVFGDALANLLAFAGYDVTREYYINDAGAQVDVLARSAFLRYREALGEEIGEIPAGLYPGDYLKPVGQALAQKYGDSLLGKDESEWLEEVRLFATDMMMEAIREDLAALGITFDVFFSERSMIAGERDIVAATLEEMREKGLVYEGKLPPPKGKLPDDWEDREQTLFRATDFGDDEDRALVKADGSYTYFASDIAYHHNKFQRGFQNLIDVWGADHSGYIKRMQAAVKAVSGEQAALDVKICQLVNLFRDGQPVKMSKRAGTFVTLRDVVDEVGADSVRFMMLYRKNDAPLDFDFAKVVDKTRENPVFYVQYAHARSHSVLYRKLPEVFPDVDVDKVDLAEMDMSQLKDEGEIGLVKKLAEFPGLVEGAAQSHEPHRIAFYLYELASDLHAQWAKGQLKPHLRFIDKDQKELTILRMVLVLAIARTLATGLRILGARPLEEML